MNWIELGFLGMFLSSILAATVLPFGSEAVFLGLLYAEFDPVTLTIVASIGNTIGGMITFYMGWLGKWEWLEKWFGLNHKSILKYMDKAQKHGWLYAFLTWLPGIGDVLALAIGFVKVNPFTALIWMLIGKSLRFTALAIMWKYGLELF